MDESVSHTQAGWGVGGGELEDKLMLGPEMLKEMEEMVRKV